MQSGKGRSGSRGASCGIAGHDGDAARTYSIHVLTLGTDDNCRSATPRTERRKSRVRRSRAHEHAARARLEPVARAAPRSTVPQPVQPLGLRAEHGFGNLALLREPRLPRQPPRGRPCRAGGGLLRQAAPGVERAQRASVRSGQEQGRQPTRQYQGAVSTLLPRNLRCTNNGGTASNRRRDAGAAGPSRTSSRGFM